jgi:16S rRNA processing protein RimM
MNLDDYFNLGYIRKSVGLKGEVLLFIDADDPQRYHRHKSFLIYFGEQLIPYFVEHLRIREHTAVVKFANLESADQAAMIVGCPVYLPMSDLPPLEGAKSFYFHEIIGYQVTDQSQGEIGIVKDLMTRPMQEILVVENPLGEILIPLTDQILVSIDRSARQILIDAPEGLIDLYLGQAE